MLDTSVHPPIVHRLHYEFEFWGGDVVVASFPVFLATTEARDAILDAGLTGMTFEEAEVTVSETFEELRGTRNLPLFVWLKPQGHAGQDDFGTIASGRLVVSRRALDLLERLGIPNALVEEFTG